MNDNVKKTKQNFCKLTHIKGKFVFPSPMTKLKDAGCVNELRR